MKTILLTSSFLVRLLFILATVHGVIFFWLSPEVGALKIVNSAVIFTALIILICLFINRIYFKGIDYRKIYVLFWILILYSLFVSFRSLGGGLSTITTLLGNNTFGLGVWLCPLLILFGGDTDVWNYVLNLFSRLSKIAVCFIPFIGVLDPSFSKALIFNYFYFLPLMIILAGRFLRYNSILTLLLILPFLHSANIYGSRSSLIVILLSIFIALLSFFLCKNKSIITKIVSLLALCTLFVSLTPSLLGYVQEKSETTHLSQDTRSFLFEELFEDMSSLEVVIGKGALGTYYSDTFSNLNIHGIGIGDDYRGLIEVSYLQIILKGGLLMLIPIVTIMLYSSYLGLLHSSNYFVKALACNTIVMFIMMFISYPVAFDGRYLLLWLGVGACLSDDLRSYNDNEISSKVRLYSY